MLRHKAAEETKKVAVAHLHKEWYNKTGIIDTRRNPVWNIFVMHNGSLLMLFPGLWWTDISFTNAV